jgi:uncharacterized protein YecT (DUF1311 family)
MIASLILPVLAQAAAPPVPGWNCAEPIVQQEMNWCAGQDYAVADAELNAQWTITAAAMKSHDADFAASGAAAYDKRAGHFRSLLEAQRAWLRYRDAHCRTEGYQARGGSMEPLLASSCKADLTRKRTEQLKDLVESP